MKFITPKIDAPKLDIRKHVREWMKKIAEQEEAFLVYHLYKHDLDPEDYVMVTNMDRTEMYLRRKTEEERNTPETAIGRVQVPDRLKSPTSPLD